MSEGDIPEDFVGMPPNLDKCAVDTCKLPAEWGRVHCVYHLRQFEDDARKAWREKRMYGG